MISIKKSQFNKLFPFFILTDNNLIVEACGKSLQMLMPELNNSHLTQNFKILRPATLNVDFESVKAICEQLVILESVHDQKLRLRGQFELIENDTRFIFVGSPWFDSVDQLLEYKLVMSDFAHHDPMFDMLHVLKAQEIINSDLKDLLQTVKLQKNQLKKAADEVRDIALFPQQNPDPLIRINAKGNIITQNPRAAELTSFNLDGKTMDPEAYWMEMVKGFDINTDRIMVESSIGDDYYSFVVRPIKEMGYYNIYGRKITEQKKNEELLRVLSSIAAENTHGVVIADSEGKVEWINKSFEKISGYRLEEIIGKKPGSFLQGPQTDPKAIIYLSDCIKAGEPFTTEILNYKKDKTPYWLRIQGQALKDIDGNVTKYFAIEEDITQRIESEKKYRELETKLRLTLDRLGDYVWEHNFKTGITKFTNGFNKFLGISVSNNLKIDKLWWDSVYKEDKPLLIKNDLNYKKGAIDHHVMEYRMKDKDGQVRWVLDRGVVIEKDSNGKPLQVIGTHTDITRQKELEKEIERQKYFYEQILTNSPVEVSVIDSSDQFLYVNPVAHQDVVVRKWMQGKSLEEVFHDSHHKAAWKQIIQKARTSGHLQSREEAIKDKGGKEKHMLYNYFPISGEKSSKSLVVCYGVDITSVKNALKKAEESEKKYRDIYENSLAIISTHDLKGRFLTINPIVSQVFGYTEKELVGKDIASFMPKKDQEEFYSDYLTRVITQKKATGINTIIHKDGRKVYTLYNNFLQEEPGKEPYIISFGVDITDRIIAEKQLKIAKKESEELAKIKQNFLANMSHEIRTPMNAIVGMTGQLLKTTLNEDQQFYVSTINNATENLLVIVNDILDLSKLEAGKMTIEQIGFEPTRVFTGVAKLLKHKIEEKGLLFVSRFDPDINPVLLGDPVRISQILLNVLSNAVKFTERGSIILEALVIKNLPDSQKLEISITDTGIGMDEEFVRKLFSKFSQEYRSAARIFGGTGLGMSITRELLALMGGEIEVKSTKGKGTTVIVTCNFKKGTEEMLATDITVVRNSAILSGKSVLIVDDNEMNRLVASTVLKNYNIKVSEAINGQDAFEKIKAQNPDIVLMDIQMPILDGFDSTALVRKNGINTPIIAVTANAIKGEYEKCIKAGMNDYLAKPYKEEDLIALLIKWVEARITPTPNQKGLDNTTSHIQTELYNLSSLREISRGDENFVRSMINLFCEQTPQEVEGMIQAYESTNLSLMGSIAHKIKPSIDNLGIEQLGQTVRSVEKFGKENVNDPSLPALLGQIKSVTTAAVSKLKTEFGFE